MYATVYLYDLMDQEEHTQKGNDDCGKTNAGQGNAAEDVPAGHKITDITTEGEHGEGVNTAKKQRVS